MDSTIRTIALRIGERVEITTPSGHVAIDVYPSKSEVRIRPNLDGHASYDNDTDTSVMYANLIGTITERTHGNTTRMDYAQFVSVIGDDDEALRMATDMMRNPGSEISNSGMFGDYATYTTYNPASLIDQIRSYDA